MFSTAFVPLNDSHLLVAPTAQGRYGRRHLAFSDFPGGISKMAGEAFLKCMRVPLPAVNDDADENNAHKQDSGRFLPHRVTISIV
jgi:hypothetical protein